MLGKFLNTLDLKLNAGANLVKFIAEFCYDYFGKGLDLYSESEYLNGEYMHRMLFLQQLLNLKIIFIKLI